MAQLSLACLKTGDTKIPLSSKQAHKTKGYGVGEIAHCRVTDRVTCLTSLTKKDEALTG